VFRYYFILDRENVRGYKIYVSDVEETSNWFIYTMLQEELKNDYTLQEVDLWKDKSFLPTCVNREGLGTK